MMEILANEKVMGRRINNAMEWIPVGVVGLALAFVPSHAVSDEDLIRGNASHYL